MGSFIHAIQDFGVQVKHISRGCTSLCQPVDVDFDKLFKNNVRKYWQQWMLNNGGKGRSTKRSEVMDWIDGGQNSVSAMIESAWRHEPFYWFAKEK